jgi:tetratricopeptide (TPR) repeat protein
VLTNDGTVFLSSDRPGGQGGFDVYQSRFIDGQYTSVRNLGDSVNTDGGDHIACAAPDASFLILYHLDVKDKASGGLYITFRKGNGIWTTAKSMGDHINSHNAQSASLSPDGKFLFFLSRGDGMYWLRADLIEYLNNEDLSVSEIMIETFQREGLSAALAVYAELKDRHADFIDIDEYLLNQRGHTLLYSGHVDEAIVLFEICVALDPDSWNAYDSLGEAYIEAGLIDQAIESYEKSLELNARNKNAAVILERLRR